MLKLVLLVTFCTALAAGKEIGSSDQLFDVDVQLDENMARLESMQSQLSKLKAIHDTILSVDDSLRMFDETRAKRQAEEDKSKESAKDPEAPEVQAKHLGAPCCG